MSARPQVIYHMTPRSVWDAQEGNAAFVEDTLDSEGFIHCTAEAELLPVVANRFYRATVGEWVLLCVDTGRLSAEVRWEAADAHVFPHIYGPIDGNAVVDVLPFPRNAAGEFLPVRLAGRSPTL